MELTFDAWLDGKDIRVRIGSDVSLAAPVFCFSIQAPARVEVGGEIIRSVGGYTEIALPDLVAGEVHEVLLGYADPYFDPANRAWLPLGGYLRLAGGRCVALPVMPAGVMSEDAEYPPCDGLRLVPPPTGWEPLGGTLALQSVDGSHPALSAVDDLARRSGLAGFVGAGVSVEASLVADLPPEAYRLTIAPDGLRIEAGSEAGVFYAGVSLVTLRRTHAGAVPCGVITDAPRFSWRGQHMDCARHFFEIGTLKRLLDLMALLKMNRFHWHFADDEAFRVQTDTAPELWRQTEYRGEGEVIPGVFGGGIRQGGSYSKAEIADLVAYAKALHIEILPEIEVPAHALCLNAVIPGLRDPDDPGGEASVQGYVDNSVNPAMPATWALLKPLAVEVASLFPFGTLHLGGDELAPATWDNSPAATALKAREGLETRDDLQGWTMAHLAADLVPRGVRPAAWEEASRGCQGGIGHDALIFSWTGQGVGVEAARRGHDVVMCPAQHTYLDMAHTDAREDWGANWAAFIALEDTVNWSPVPVDAPEIADRVVGVQGTFWCEFTCVDAEMEPMLAPRILGVACKAWEADGQTDGARLRALAGAYAPLFDAIGWARHRGA